MRDRTKNYKDLGELVSNFYKTHCPEWRGTCSRCKPGSDNEPYVMHPYQNQTRHFPIIANAAQFAASLP